MFDDAKFQQAVQRAVAKAIQTLPEPYVPEEILKAEEVAKMLRVRRATIMRWVKENGLPRHMLGGGTPRFRRSEVLSWVSEHPALLDEEEAA